MTQSNQTHLKKENQRCGKTGVNQSKTETQQGNR